MRPDELQVPLDRVAKFVRQLAHDARNNLGSMDLQAAYISELVADPEVITELKKLRGMIAEAARSIQAVSASFSVPRATPLKLAASIFIEDLRERLLKLFPEQAPQVLWSVEIGEEQIAVDIEMVFSAVSEFVRNAFYFHEQTQPIAAHVRVQDETLIIELCEKRNSVDAPPETWGLMPLVTTRRGGYGLGVFHARQMIAAHGGAVEFAHDPNQSIVTARITLPLDSSLENDQ